jgi:hypothetical protein
MMKPLPEPDVVWSASRPPVPKLSSVSASVDPVVVLALVTYEASMDVP